MFLLLLLSLHAINIVPEIISNTTFQNDVFNPQIIGAVTVNASLHHKTCHEIYGYFYRDRSVILHVEMTQLNHSLM
jgi:hypothetical protein